MARAFDGTIVPESLPKQTCGGTPYFDHESGYAYRCDYCNAVIGSMGQSDQCKELNKNDKQNGNRVG